MSAPRSPRRHLAAAVSLVFIATVGDCVPQREPAAPSGDDHTNDVNAIVPQLMRELGL